MLTGSIPIRLRAALIVLLLAVTAFAQEPKQPSSGAADSCTVAVAGIEHSEALADACRFALSLRHTLPNFFCDQKTARYKREPDRGQQLLDILTAHVIYEDGKERYTGVKVDGEPASAKDIESIGQYSTGEFGSDLVFAFWPGNHPSYAFLRRDHIDSRAVLVYTAHVAHENNHSWRMDAGSQHTFPEFNATIWLDQTTHDIVRLDVVPVPERGFPIINAHIRTEYRRLSLGDGSSFILPVRSESGSCLWNDQERYFGACNLNVLSFTNCHKFTAKSHIVTDLNSTVK